MTDPAVWRSARRRSRSIVAGIEPLDRGGRQRLGAGGRRRGRDVSRPGAQPQPGPARPVPRVRSVRAAGAARRSSGFATRSRRAGRACGWRCTTGSGGSRSARPASSSRRRRAHRARCVRRVPLRDRARQADRADLEARVLRGRRRLDRRRDGRTRTTRRRAPRRSGSHARDRAAVRAAARHRRRRRADARGRAAGATVGVGVAASWSTEFPELGRLRAVDLDRGERRLRAHESRRSATATRWRFCRRCPGG